MGCMCTSVRTTCGSFADALEEAEAAHPVLSVKVQTGILRSEARVQNISSPSRPLLRAQVLVVVVTAAAAVVVISTVPSPSSRPSSVIKF